MGEKGEKKKKGRKSTHGYKLRTNNIKFNSTLIEIGIKGFTATYTESHVLSCLSLSH